MGFFPYRGIAERERAFCFNFRGKGNSGSHAMIQAQESFDFVLMVIVAKPLAAFAVIFVRFLYYLKGLITIPCYIKQIEVPGT
jgi:hypothetical protein